jgi:hypothetical protein
MILEAYGLNDDLANSEVHRLGISNEVAILGALWYEPERFGNSIPQAAFRNGWGVANSLDEVPWPGKRSGHGPGYYKALNIAMFFSWYRKTAG